MVNESQTCLKIVDNYRLITSLKYTGDGLPTVLPDSKTSVFRRPATVLEVFIIFLITFGNSAI